MARLKERIEQEEARRKLAAERAQEEPAPDSSMRALPVGVRRGRLSPRGERADAIPPSSHAHDLDALDRYLANAGIVAESEAVRSYLLPWLTGSDVLAFVPADKAALVGCGAVTLANRKKAMIVVPTDEAVADQVGALQSARIEVATLSSNQEERTIELSRLGGESSYVVVVSLERLFTEDVLDECRKLSIDLLAIDEAQRVSELAPDFDPGLERLADLAPRLGRPPTLALLRAVPPSVRSDLPHRLGLRNPLRVDLSPVHETLSLDVVSSDPSRRVAQVTDLMRRAALPAVVLGYSMADVNDILAALGNAGMDARRFDPASRPTAQDLSAEAVWVVPTGRVSTPVQFAQTLVHFRAPPSLEQYCRDLGWVAHSSGHAKSVMVVSSDDEAMVKGTLERQRPRAEDLVGIAGVLVRHGSNASTVLLDSLCPSVGMNRARVESLVSIFGRTGWVDHAQDWVRLRADCPDLVERARGLGARLKTAKERDAQRLRSVSAYVVSRGCRQESLRRHFGTAGSRPCGLCDACLSGRNVTPASSSGRSTEDGNPPASRPFGAEQFSASRPFGGEPSPAPRPYGGDQSPASRPFGGNQSPAARPFEGGNQSPAARPLGGNQSPAKRPFEGGNQSPAARPLGGNQSPAERPFEGGEQSSGGATPASSSSSVGENDSPVASSGRSVEEGNAPVSRAITGEQSSSIGSANNDRPVWTQRRRLIHF
jgi:ATP-dependent DNA helicase RecQ